MSEDGVDLDSHLKEVIMFMQSNVPASKLIGVADAIPQIARLLWARYPQEPLVAVSLSPKKLHQSQSTAIL